MGSFTRPGMIRVLAAAAMLLAGTAASVAAQGTGTIRGRVTDAATQRPLSGAQVTVVGTSRQAVTNEAGEYSLGSVAPGALRVRAELIGRTASEQAVTVTGGQTARADFALATSALELDALVVTGTVGATARRAIGNAVTTIQATEAVEKAPIATVSQLLQGRAPGVTLIQPSGSQGTATNIRIRGTGSLNAGNQPIFVIDGVRMSAGGQSGYSVSGQRTSALDAINPEDIESMEVIKGPAAATLYGADAAAGVIQIITKKGKPGQQKIQWNAKVEQGREEWSTPIPDRYTFCTPARIRTSGSGLVNSFPGCAGIDSLAPAEQRIIAGNNLRDDPAALRTGELRNYSLSARGGGEGYSFYVSGDMDDNAGIFHNNYFDRMSGLANFQARPTSTVDFSMRVGYTQTEIRLPNNDNSSWGILRNTYRAQPGRLYNYAVGYANLDPAIINGYDNVTRSERLIVGAQAQYQPTDWFTNQVTVGLDRNSRRNTLFFTRDLTGKQPYGATNAAGWIGNFIPGTHTWTAEYAGSLSRDLASELSSKLSFGAQYNHYQFRSYEATGEGLTTDRLNLVSSATITKGFEGFSEDKSFGVYAQEQLGWRDRLFVTGTVRLDDNSTFGADYSGAVYPNIQASYVISDEPFFSVPGVESLRLRAAWGKAGKAPSAYQADRTYEASAVVLADNTVAPSFSASTYGNSELKAEEVSEIETGFEATFFGGRSTLDVTYYNKTTEDAIIGVPVPPSSGFTGSRLTNVGTINNRGVEVSLSGTPVAARALNWDTRLGVSFNKNELTSWGGARNEPILVGYRSAQRHDVGKPLGAFYGIGVSYNADGTPKRDAARRLVLGDTAYIGSSVPTREIGFTNTFTIFGNLSLYSFFDYKGGHYQFNMTEATAHTDGLTRIQVYQANAADSLQAEILRSGATLPFFSKADFVKLRELSLTYAVPTRFTGTFGADRVSLSLAGRNLALWTKYEGPDPEVNIEGDATFTRADYMTVPATRQWVATVNVSF